MENLNYSLFPSEDDDVLELTSADISYMDSYFKKEHFNEIEDICIIELTPEQKKEASIFETIQLAKVVISGESKKCLSSEDLSIANKILPIKQVIAVGDSKIEKEVEKESYPETLGINPICPAWQMACKELEKDFGIKNTSGWQGLVYARRQAIILRGV